MPPYRVVGRPNRELLHIYSQYKILLSNYTQLSHNVALSSFDKLSLQEYCQARELFCSSHHISPCFECVSMLQAARKVLNSGIYPLCSLFKEVFPQVTYHTGNAKRRFLQMPIVAIRIQNVSRNNAEWYVTELIHGVDYLKLSRFLNLQAQENKCSAPNFLKAELKQLLVLAQSDRERELIKLATFQASGLTKTSARRHFGFENISNRLLRLEQCIEEAESVRECINSLSGDQEKAVALSVGVAPDDDSCSTSSDDQHNTCDDPTVFSENEGFLDNPVTTAFTIAHEEFLVILKEPVFNWFEVVKRVTEWSSEFNEGDVIVKLEHYFFIAMNDESLCDKDKTVLEQSHRAFKLDMSRQDLVNREADALNGLIVTDSDSDDPDNYLDLQDFACDKAKTLIAKKRKQIKRRANYLKSKKVAEQNFLSRKVSRKVRGILDQFPNIGKEIEAFVEESNVGAEAWRRTGVLTFDGNTRVKSKVTYERIRQHLIRIHNRNFHLAQLYSYVWPEIKEETLQDATKVWLK